MRVIEQVAKAAYEAWQKFLPVNMVMRSIKWEDGHPDVVREPWIAAVEAALRVYNVNPELVQQCRDKLVNVMAHVASESPPPLPGDLLNRKIMSPPGSCMRDGCIDETHIGARYCPYHTALLADDVQPDITVG